MFKSLIYISISFIVLISCGRKKDYASTHAGKFRDFRFSAESVSYFPIESSREKRSIKENMTVMELEGWTLERLDTCERATIPNGDIEKIKKYGQGNPYEIETKTTSLNVEVEFKFTDDCCKKHVGKVIKKAPQLKLYYSNISSNPCDCYCEYIYRFTIKNNREKFSNITVEQSTLR